MPDVLPLCCGESVGRLVCEGPALFARPKQTDRRRVGAKDRMYKYAVGDVTMDESVT